jgi:tight adherence protein B
MFWLIVLLVMSSSTLVFLVIFPMSMETLKRWETRKEKAIEMELDRLFADKNPKRIVKLYFILPPALGLLGYLATNSFITVIVGAFIGLFIPNFILKMKKSRIRSKFNNQILDAIMILSSSLKGGLSLIQSLEVLVEEMPVPMSQEIGLVIRENKMGVTLEESLKHLDERMNNMEELNLVLNSIMVARETGGDLTKVLSRLSTSIRDNRKLKDAIKTLTMQGRLQGVIMTFLPILFVSFVLSTNRRHFDIMLNTELGRVLVFVAVILQVVGMVLIRRFSAINL